MKSTHASDLLRAAKVRHRLSYREWEQRSGIPMLTIWRICQGGAKKIPDRTFCRLLQVLGYRVSVSYEATPRAKHA